MSRQNDKSLQQLWGKLAKQVGVQKLAEPIKDALLEEYEDEIDYALNTGDLELLSEKAKGFNKVYLAPRGAGRRPNRTTSTESDRAIIPEVGSYERLRAEVLSEYLAKMAAIDPKVAGFKNEVLNGEVHTPKEARAFLSSPATRFLTRNMWQKYRIPAKHSAMLLKENQGLTEDGPFHFVEVRTDPPGMTYPVFYDISAPRSYGHLTFASDDGTPRKVWFWPHSVLGNLRKVCKELVKAHPWGVDEAAWFVLTEEIAFVHPIRGKINSSTVLGTSAHYTTISLTVQPWVLPETVESVYRQVQKRATGGNSGRIGEKNLHLLRFVAERADAAGMLPKGRTLVKEWDKRWREERPQWCYGTDTRTFWRDVRSVQKSLTNSSRAGLVLEPSEKASS